MEISKENSLSSYFKNLTNKDKIILASTMILFIVVMGTKYLILPQVDKYINNSAQLTELKYKEETIVRVNEENEKLKEKNEALSSEYNDALKALPLTNEEAQIAYDLNNMISNSEATIVSISFSDTVIEGTENNVETNEDGAIDEVDRGIEAGDAPDEHMISSSIKKQVANINVKGSYDEVMSLIKSIEGYSRVAEVSTVSITTDEQGLNASLTANFYNLDNGENESYEFNNGSYGKTNSFE